MKNKGGAPSLTTRKHHNEMQALGLFNRDSFAYLAIETELDSLPPAKAFDIFCHYCARRDTPDAYILVQDIPDRLKIIVDQRKNMLVENKIKESLLSLSNLSEHAFVTYMDILYYDYHLSQQMGIFTPNDFSFEISTGFSFEYLSRFYSEKQLKSITEYLFNEYLQQDEEFNKIYTESTDKTSIKELGILRIINHKRIDMLDVVSNIKSPFYIQDRTELETGLMVTRYKDIDYIVSEKSPKKSMKPISYHPSASIQINMDKPIEYIHEMLQALKHDWTETSEFLGIKEEKKDDLLELRHKVMRFKKVQKTLSGKLTDLLYVYDCKKFGLTNPWTKNQIYRYWKTKKAKGKHGDAMSDSTHYEYLKLIQTMIDQKYYKNY